MALNVLFEWEGQEYEHNPKSADWYWALGIVAVAGTIAAILFSSYLVAVLILVAAATISLHGAKHPPLHRFRVVDRGLMIGEELYSYDEMISFAVLEDIEDELPPLLSIKNDHWFTPHLMIPLQGVDVDHIYAHFLANVDEDKHPPTMTDVVAAWLGF